MKKETLVLESSIVVPVKKRHDPYGQAGMGCQERYSKREDQGRGGRDGSGNFRQQL